MSQTFEVQAHLAAAGISEVDYVSVESWCLEPIAAAEMSCHCCGDTDRNSKQNKCPSPVPLPSNLPLAPPVDRKLYKPAGKEVWKV